MGLPLYYICIVFYIFSLLKYFFKQEFYGNKKNPKKIGLLLIRCL
ncbi:hypothetical protein B14911_12667 [Bacillus sp. NRRL B-14911]|nr:hypothetical protein B14911_12667 [Bacillus sp. NRRL B-14911]